MRTDRRLRACQTLEAHGWTLYCRRQGGLTATSSAEGGWTLEGMADSAELLFFRPPGRTDRQVRIGLHGGLTWMYQDRNGRWRSRRVRGGEEAGIDETLEALRAFDEKRYQHLERVAARLGESRMKKTSRTTADPETDTTAANPTLTVELTEDGAICVGVFRNGRIDKGGFVSRSREDYGVWVGETARQTAAGEGPAYRGRSRAEALMTTIGTLDREERAAGTSTPGAHGR